MAVRVEWADEDPTQAEQLLRLQKRTEQTQVQVGCVSTCSASPPKEIAGCAQGGFQSASNKLKAKTSLNSLTTNGAKTFCTVIPLFQF